MTTGTIAVTYWAPGVVGKDLLEACMHTFVFRPDVTLDVSFSALHIHIYIQDPLLILEAADSGKVSGQ